MAWLAPIGAEGLRLETIEICPLYLVHRDVAGKWPRVAGGVVPYAINRLAGLFVRDCRLVIHPRDAETVTVDLRFPRL